MKGEGLGGLVTYMYRRNVNPAKGLEARVFTRQHQHHSWFMRFFVGHHAVSAICLPDITARDQISQAFPSIYDYLNAASIAGGGNSLGMKLVVLAIGFAMLGIPLVGCSNQLRV